MAEVLYHETVTAGDEPARWIYVLHGIYGAGRNWASVLRRVVRSRPEWGAVLVDLRMHGRSQGMSPPHTVDAAATDLAGLADATGLRPHAVLGHSFGGKVALLFAGLDVPAAGALDQVWVVDSTPDARPPSGSAWTMLNLLRSMPARFRTRSQLVEALTGHGVHEGVAQWMATNLEPCPGGFRWRFDLDAMESLLLSFFETAAWDVVESPREGLEVHVVKAEASSVLEGQALERAEAAARRTRTFVHRVAGGHWVNAENPAAVEDLLVRMLPHAG
ncbi:MAG TPA: alpha/beta hydrolase [Longimicrobiales bacterium]|nr:alpha/beta hydrolase [Longimicrobiales bacterium]